MWRVVSESSGFSRQTALVTEIPSFEAGLVAFLIVFVLMGIMFYILRTERDKTIPPLKTLGPTDTVRFEGALSRSDAPYVAIMTLVMLELILDALIVVSVVEGMGSTSIGTMLAFAAFLAAAILAVYRSAYMGDAFTRKRRLEIVSASLFETAREGEKND
mgnify:CR=1 FL=1